MDSDSGDADTGMTSSGLLPEQEATSPPPAAQAAPTDIELAHAALICGYTAQDASRQMDDSALAQHFGISPRIISASPDAFYRRWVIQTVRQILPSSPEDCRAILDNPQDAPAITQKLLANRQADAPATAAPETPADNKPRYAPGTSQRIQDAGDQIAELQRRPQGEVSQQEIDDVLGTLHALRKAPDITNTEHNNLVGLGLTAFTIAASHGLKTAPETVNDPLFTDAAASSMAFSGGNSSLKASGSPAVPVLPRTGSSFVAGGNGTKSIAANTSSDASKIAQVHNEPADTGTQHPIDNHFSQHVESLKNKLPPEWGAGLPNRKGIGTRWQDPENPGNRVRIDKGNPDNNQPSQQDHHVIVHSDGKILGRDGKPIRGRIKDYPEDAHIPLSEYLTWKKWNAPS